MTCTVSDTKHTVVNLSLPIAILSLYHKEVLAYNIIRFMQMEHPKDREQVIDVIDEIADDISIAIRWIIDPIPSCN